MNGELHINRPSSTRYRVRVRLPGYRRWQLVGGNHQNLSCAAETLGRVMGDGEYKRGEVLVTADYYEPIPILEMVRR